MLDELLACAVEDCDTDCVDVTDNEGDALDDGRGDGVVDGVIEAEPKSEVVTDEDADDTDKRLARGLSDADVLPDMELGGEGDAEGRGEELVVNQLLLVEDNDEVALAEAGALGESVAELVALSPAD